MVATLGGVSQVDRNSWIYPCTRACSSNVLNPCLPGTVLGMGGMGTKMEAAPSLTDRAVYGGSLVWLPPSAGAFWLHNPLFLSIPVRRSP